MGKPNISGDLVREIVLLRQSGHSINEIKRLVPVSKSTISRYVKRVEVTPYYQGILDSKRAYSVKRKSIHLNEAASDARKLIGEISQREAMCLVVALYWAEGTKRDFCLVNTDPALIKVFTECLQRVFKVPRQDLLVSIRIYEDLDRDECIEFWANLLEIEKNAILSVTVLSGKKKGKSPYGMCRIRVRRAGKLLKLFVALREEISSKLALVPTS